MAQAKTVAVVGGGAAGLMAAVVAAEHGCAVTVYEATDRVGRPILASGNGRCNFSNSMLDPGAYHNAEFVREALIALDAAYPCVPACSADEEATAIVAGASECAGASANALSLASASASASASAFSREGAHVESAPPANPFTRPVHTFFSRHGLVWAEEGQGRLYPVSRKATSVLDVLRFSAQAAGVDLRCSMPIASVEPPRAEGKPFTLRTQRGEFKRADAVIVAVGGTIARGLLPDEVPFEPTRPVLGPLATDTDIVRMLDNTRVRADVVLCDCGGMEKARERGEVLFRKYGVSGIAVFNLSRWAQPGDEVRITLLPEVPDMPGAGNGPNAIGGFLRARHDVLAALYSPLSAEAFFRGLFPSVLAEAVCKQAGVGYEQPLHGDDIGALARTIAAFSLMVKGIGDVKQCQVHRGGVPVGEMDAQSMRVRAIPGLYVVGEALDVDGPCGGYNLHWAWASGMLAALDCAGCGC